MGFGCKIFYLKCSAEINYPLCSAGWSCQTGAEQAGLLGCDKLIIKCPNSAGIIPSVCQVWLILIITRLPWENCIIWHMLSRDNITTSSVAAPARINLLSKSYFPLSRFNQPDTVLLYCDVYRNFPNSQENCKIILNLINFINFSYNKLSWVYSFFFEPGRISSNSAITQISFVRLCLELFIIPPLPQINYKLEIKVLRAIDDAEFLIVCPNIT